MKKQINPTIKAHLLPTLFILLSLLAICAIPLARAQQGSKKNLTNHAVAGEMPAVPSADGVFHGSQSLPNLPSGGTCQYNIAQIGGSIVPGTTDIGNHGDDTVVTIPLPFPFCVYDNTFTSINLSSNGNAQFTTTDATFTNQCLPWLTHNYAIYPYWDDLYLVNSGFGIFTSISGTAPNRIFNIEWRAQYFPGSGAANFELRLYEGQCRFDIIYGTLTNGNTSATAGVQQNDTNFQQYFCNGSGGAATGGQSYILSPCGTPTPTPSCTPGAWSQASPYPITDVRYGFAQTATHFYVFGGVSNGTRVNNVNRMDLATGMWQARAPMPFTSEAPTCALMAATNKVYCAEGDTGSGFASYDIATDTWTPLASIPGGDHYGSASGAFNGKVFVAGGTTGFTSAVQVYDVATNTWSAGTAAPNDFLLAGYQQVGQFLYVVGGFEAAGPDAAAMSSVLNRGRQSHQPRVPMANNTTTLRLDMSSAPGVWSTGPVFTEQRADFGLAYDPGTNKLYALGGDAAGGGFFDSTNLVDELSIASWPAGTWTASPANLILPNRQANQAGFYGSGNIWSVGGIVGQTFQFLAEVQRRANACPTPTCTPGWRTEPSMSTARRNPATTVVGSNLYAITGFDSVSPYTTINERFDGTTWTTRAPIPVRHAQGRATSVGTRIYVPGGFNSIDFGGPINNMQIYDTGADSWSQGMVLPAARSGVATATFNGLVYVIAGYNPVGTGHTDVYIYDPVANSYTTGAPMPAGEGNAAGVLYNGEIYVVGGGTAPGAQYAYNPTTNTWRTIAVLPTSGGTCQSDNGFVQDGELWIVGCLGLAINQQVWIYNSGTDSWRAGPPYSVDHQGPGAAPFNGRGFVVGGGAASGGSAAVESYGSCAPVVTGAVSRMTHGAAGNFDIALPLTGTDGVECRTQGGTHDFTMVVTFGGNVTVTGSPQAQVTSGTGCVGSAGVCTGNVTVSGNVVTVPLTTIADQQNINVRINGVNSADAPATDINIPMGVLAGDTNANRTVNAADVSQTKGQSGQPVTAANFRNDVNANGSINAGDINIVKANSGHSIP